MAVTQGKIAHGPLRMIITVDEEDGMDGALNISPVWFNGASFLINIDNEWSSEVLVSTAAGDDSRIEKKISQVNPMGNMALKIGILNLKGGHSGVEIDK
jgi:dipeptidase D